MTDDDRAACERIHAALQDEAPNMLDEAGAEAVVLTNWIAVCEWVDEKGERCLSRWQLPGAPGWQVRGMLHEALFNWPAPQDDE